MTKKKAISLLSGGLDSVMSLVVSLKIYDIEQAVFFDYGQKALKKEINAVNKICEFYKIPYKVVKLDWLKDITNTSLVKAEEMVPEYTVEELESDMSVLKNSARLVWVPNRNGVMLNICGAYADSLSCDTIIFGANAEEASTFPDNSTDYVNQVSKTFSYSTSNGVIVEAPLSEKTKTEIVSLAIAYNVPFDFLWSCYYAYDKHCGKCESCVRLQRALNNNNCNDIWRSISL